MADLKDFYARGSKLAIKDDGSIVGTEFDTINVVGDLTATDAGNNEATIAVTATGSSNIEDGINPGDLLVFDGTSYRRLPAGANGTVLTRDAGEALGVIWANFNPSGGTSFFIPLATIANQTPRIKVASTTLESPGVTTRIDVEPRGNAQIFPTTSPLGDITLIDFASQELV